MSIWSRLTGRGDAERGLPVQGTSPAEVLIKDRAGELQAEIKSPFRSERALEMSQESSKPSPALNSQVDATHGQQESVRSNCVLDQSLCVKGKLFLNDGDIIRGEHHGTVHCGGALTVGEGARVVADIECQSIQINGSLEGTIKARGFVGVSKTASVEGAVVSPKIAVESGATLKASFSMSSTDSPSSGIHEGASLRGGSTSTTLAEETALGDSL